MHPDIIKQLIEEKLHDSVATIRSKDLKHYTAVVVSPAFHGKNRIQKQQLIYEILGKFIHDGTIHALSLKTVTPEEWTKLQTITQ